MHVMLQQNKERIAVVNDEDGDASRKCMKQEIYNIAPTTEITPW